MTRILIICTGNSCRSQMAEAILRSFDASLEVYSAGTLVASRVQPNALKVLREIGIEHPNARPKSVESFLDKQFDFVITVCDHARETCPLFTGKVGRRLHMGFQDPSALVGPEEVILQAYRRVRDEMVERFKAFYDIDIATGRS
jgi:arsenate reductase